MRTALIRDSINGLGSQGRTSHLIKEFLPPQKKSCLATCLDNNFIFTIKSEDIKYLYVGYHDYPYKVETSSDIPRKSSKTFVQPAESIRREKRRKE